MTIAPLTVVWPAADNSAVAVPFAAKPILALWLTFWPLTVTSICAATSTFFSAEMATLPLALMVMSLGLSSRMPDGLSSTLLPVWSCSRIDFASSLMTTLLLAGVIRVMIFLSSSYSIFNLLRVTSALILLAASSG